MVRNIWILHNAVAQPQWHQYKNIGGGYAVRKKIEGKSEVLHVAEGITARELLGLSSINGRLLQVVRIRVGHKFRFGSYKYHFCNKLLNVHS